MLLLTGITGQPVGDAREVRLSTVGKPFSGNQVKLIDENGREVPQGSIGEITVAGPCSNSGYYKDVEATNQMWDRDGGFRVGDLARFDEKGGGTLNRLFGIGEKSISEVTRKLAKEMMDTLFGSGRKKQLKN